MTVIIIIDIEPAPYQYLPRNANRILRLYPGWTTSLQEGQILLICSFRQSSTETIVQLSDNNVRLQGTAARSFAGRDANRSVNFCSFHFIIFLQHSYQILIGRLEYYKDIFFDVGTHQIQLHSLMNSLLSMQVSQHSKAPCRTMKNAFKITTATGQHVGEVTVFIRVSCFGKKIVTQFQLPHNKKPYLFKGVNNGPVYQCKRVTSALDRQQIKCVCSPKNGNGSGEAARTYSASADERRRKRQLEDIRKDKCPPCCRGTRDIVKSKETVRKCGCVVKEERTCNCARSNIKYST